MFRFLKKKIKAESIYMPPQKNDQTRNFSPSYFDNVNYTQAYAIKKGLTDGLALATNNTLGSGIVKTIVREAIGNGLNCESAINKTFLHKYGITDEQIDEIQQEIENFFDFWSEDAKYCDFHNVCNLGQLEQMITKTAISQGEVFVIIRIVNVNGTFFPQIELVSPLLCSSPNNVDTEKIVNGIEFSKDGKEVAYYFKIIENNNPSSYQWKRYPKYSINKRISVIHAKFDDVHPSQIRGRSELASAKESLVQVDRFVDANLSKAVTQAGISYSIEKDINVVEEATTTLDDIKSAVLSSQTNNIDNVLGQQTVEETEPTLEIKPGLAIELRPGERLKSFESSAPVTGFNDFISTMVDILATDNGVPRQKLFKKYDSSYSASQAVMQEAHKNAEYWLNEVCKSVLNEIYNQFVWCLAAQNLVKLPYYFENEFIKKAYSRIQWYGQALVHIDPVKAVKASAMKLKYGLSTYEIETRNLTGQSWDVIISKLSAEREKIKELNPSLSDPLGLGLTDDNEKDEE